MTETVKILLTGLLTFLASSGLWNYRVRKLERKYQLEDQTNETQRKLDEILKVQKNMQAEYSELKDQINKTNEVTMALARDRIYHLCKKAIKERDLDPDIMRDIKSMLIPYKENKGDGIADEYFDLYENMYKTSGGAI